MSTPSSARRLVWMIPALGLLACAKKEAPPPSAAAPDSTAAMAMPAPPVTATVQAKNNSGITGTVTLTKKGDSTEVAVALSGARAGEKYPSHIHSGTCAKPGDVVAPLGDVTVGQGKSGTSTTMVLTSVLDSARTKFGSLVEQSHMARGMKPVACAEIPAQ
jgi:Cu/Zn superoxide dismutase